MAQPSVTDLAPRWNFTAAVAAWVFPGFGHYLLGQSHRAVILATAIGALWLAGLFIGGIGSVDRATHPAWFLAQMLTAPSLVVDFFVGRLSPVPGFGRAGELGVLFTARAGMLNLLAIIDVLYRDPRDPRHRLDAVEPEDQREPV
ncbi:MAG: DUF6677 family protein [Phycisphaeraceae bacterium]